jgi:8-oxo-dGTP pyrophosphatase MutT (NUDIX family)
MRRGEVPPATAAREVFEEVGLRILPGRLLATDVGGYGDLTFLFEARRLDNGRLSLSDEITRAAYFAPGELPPMDARTRRLIENAVAVLMELQSPRFSNCRSTATRTEAH